MTNYLKELFYNLWPYSLAVNVQIDAQQYIRL